MTDIETLRNAIGSESVTREAHREAIRGLRVAYLEAAEVGLSISDAGVHDVPAELFLEFGQDSEPIRVSTQERSRTAVMHLDASGCTDSSVTLFAATRGAGAEHLVELVKAVRTGEIL